MRIILIRNLQWSLSNVTNNINRIVKATNTTGVIYKNEIESMNKEIEKLSREIWKIHSLLLNRSKKVEVISMAITKIHPIKSTLNLAIDYITKSEKTDEKILVSSFKCHPSTAHIQFMKTREDNDTKGTVLARHLIQSFLPGETTPEMAHQIGMELCKKILKDEYEFVLSTHIDKGHIHNHIIFNNVNMVTSKCYQSNKKSYHQIRYQSDKLCKENDLSVIDEFYESYKKKIPSCKSILTPNLLWTSFIKYERTMEFTGVKRWRDNVSPSPLTILFF